jgi:hypothetical protein
MTGLPTRCGRCSNSGCSRQRGRDVQVAAHGRGGRKAGHIFSQPDLIIGATALHHGLTVVTRDTGDYLSARVPVLNPWTAPTAGCSSQVRRRGGHSLSGGARRRAEVSLVNAIGPLLKSASMHAPQTVSAASPQVCKKGGFAALVAVIRLRAPAEAIGQAQPSAPRRLDDAVAAFPVTVSPVRYLIVLLDRRGVNNWPAEDVL